MKGSDPINQAAVTKMSESEYSAHKLFPKEVKFKRQLMLREDGTFSYDELSTYYRDGDHSLIATGTWACQGECVKLSGEIVERKPNVWGQGDKKFSKDITDTELLS